MLETIMTMSQSYGVSDVLIYALIVLIVVSIVSKLMKVAMLLVGIAVAYYIIVPYVQSLMGTIS